MNPFDLTGRVAIVTGGNGGIGLGMAKGLTAAGAAIVVAGRNAEKNAAAVDALVKSGAKAVSVPFEATDEAAGRKAADAALKAFGRIDILINNAGTAVRKRPEETSLAEWHLVMNTNLTSAFACAQACYPHMVSAGGGKVISIGSMMSMFGSQYHASYGASKGGIVQLTRSLAAAWAKDNIQCNALLPGWIDTDLTRRGRVEMPGLNERVLARTPAGRWGMPEDFAGIAVFLASPASDFITGTAIPVDGGYSIQA
ncbi:MAG: glucose 1-dehydrogenase [Alphaproteobacteria bacterium]